MTRFLAPFVDGPAAVGLLLLRVVVGLALMMHGFSKIQHPFDWMPPVAGVPGPLLALAALSEFGGGLALILGLLTPLACLGIMSTMFVAILSHLTNAVKPTYFVKPGGPNVPGDSYELAALYFIIALMLLLMGPGVLSLDRLLFGRRRASDERFMRPAL